MQGGYHEPVLPDACLEGLNIRPEGIYVDATFGGGGHSGRILKKLGVKGRLLAFDQDADALKNVPEDERLTFVPHNFRYLKKYGRLYNMIPVDGILADLGVSSHQIDSPERGFSTRYDADLDMRMDRQAGLTARDVVNDYTEQELHSLLGRYGEVHNAKTLARHIVHARAEAPVQTVNQLKEILRPLSKKGQENRYYAQVFQAFRIEVNQELDALQAFLQQTAEVLKPGGRLVVISYHSLEDRLVKNFIGKGKFSGEVEKDLYGNEIKPFEPLNRKPVRPSQQEIEKNSRARSAKLRIGIKRH